MKRFFSYICILLITFSMIGCSKNEKLTNINEFQINKAVKTINGYMAAYMKNDFQGMQKFYTEELKKKGTGQMQPSFKISSYKILDTTEMGKTANVRLNIISSDKSSPYVGVDTTIFKIKKVKGKYLIDKISATAGKEVFQYRNNLMVKIKDEAKSNILINLVGVPEYCFSKSDELELDKIKVSKDGFSFLSAYNDGNTAIISTSGANPIIGSCEIQDLEQLEGQNQSQNQSDQSLNDETQPFKVAAKSIKVIDAYKNAQIMGIMASNDDEIIAVQYNTNKTMRIKMYEAQSGDLVSKQVDSKFPDNKFNLNLIRFNEKYLIFESTPKNPKDTTSKDKSGKWIWNLKSHKVSKYAGES